MIFEVPRITEDEVQITSKIGAGMFGTVHVATYLGKPVAVKKLISSDVTAEATVLAQLRHKHIIGFYGANIEQNWLVLELAETSLFSFLHDASRSLDFARMCLWAEQIAEGMRYLHVECPMAPVIHRDLKSLNVLVTHNATVVKLCDFGTAREFEKETIMTFVGTIAWIAPEILKGEQVSLKSDVYSYALVLWELLHRQIPYGDMNSMGISYAVLFKNERPHIPATCPAAMVALLRDCWQSEPDKRPSFKEILNRFRTLSLDDSVAAAVKNFMASSDEWKNEILMSVDRLKLFQYDLLERERRLEERERALAEREALIAANATSTAASSAYRMSSPSHSTITTTNVRPTPTALPNSALMSVSTRSLSTSSSTTNTSSALNSVASSSQSPVRRTTQTPATPPSPLPSPMSTPTRPTARSALSSSSSTLNSPFTRLPSRPLMIAHWTEPEVADWLSELPSSEIRKYASNFVEHNVDGALLLFMTKDRLAEIGVASLGHREKIMYYIEKERSYQHFPPLKRPNIEPIAFALPPTSPGTKGPKSPALAGLASPNAIQNAFDASTESSAGPLTRDTSLSLSSLSLSASSSACTSTAPTSAVASAGLEVPVTVTMSTLRLPKTDSSTGHYQIRVQVSPAPPGDACIQSCSFRFPARGNSTVTVSAAPFVFSDDRVASGEEVYTTVQFSRSLYRKRKLKKSIIVADKPVAQYVVLIRQSSELF